MLHEVQKRSFPSGVERSHEHSCMFNAGNWRDRSCFCRDSEKPSQEEGPMEWIVEKLFGGRSRGRLILELPRIATISAFTVLVSGYKASLYHSVRTVLRPASSRKPVLQKGCPVTLCERHRVVRIANVGCWLRGAERSARCRLTNECSQNPDSLCCQDPSCSDECLSCRAPYD